MLRCFDRQLTPKFAVVIGVPLSQIMQQQRQVQGALVPYLPIGLTDRAGVLQKLCRALDRLNALFVDRVLGVLVELQKGACRAQRRNELLQDSELMQALYRSARRAGCDMRDRNR